MVKGLQSGTLMGVWLEEVDRLGRRYIMRHFAKHNPQTLAAQWSSHKENYPHFTEAMQGYLYCMLQPALFRNSALDRNAQADIDVMVHLLNADILVSNERRFMAEAFEFLWRPRGKVLMRVEEFLAHVDRLK